MNALRCLLAVALLATVGCSSDDDDGTGMSCTTPGQTIRCSCASGATGLQICNASSRFDACSCEGDDGGTDASSSGDGGRLDGSAGADTKTMDVGPASTPAVDACVPKRCGAEIACGTTDDGCGTVLTCQACVDGPHLLGLPARRILAHPSKPLLFATVGSDGLTYANSLVIIDPATGKVTDSVPVGSEPSQMAISRDGSTLWLGLDGAQAIRRIDISGASPVPGAQHPLPRDTGYSPAPSTIGLSVAPGSNDTVLVAVHRYSYGYDVALLVLDGGVPRPTRLTLGSGMSNLVTGPDGWVFGSTSSSGGDLVIAKMVPAGVTGQRHPNLVTGSHVAYADGRLFSSSGEVVDVSDPAAPLRAGKFRSAGAILPLPGKKRAIMIGLPDTTGSSVGPSRLRVLDTERFAEVTSVPLDIPRDHPIWDLTLVGGNTLAMVSGDVYSRVGRRVYILRTPLVP